jgi:hypothetical protein
MPQKLSIMRPSIADIGMAVSVWLNLIVLQKEIQRGKKGLYDFEAALQSILIGPPAFTFFSFGEVVIIYEDLAVDLKVLQEVGSTEDAEKAIVGASEVLFYRAVKDDGDEVMQFYASAAGGGPGAVQDGLVDTKTYAASGPPKQLVNGSILTGIIAPSIGLIGDEVYELGKKVMIFPAAQASPNV